MDECGRRTGAHRLSVRGREAGLCWGGSVNLEFGERREEGSGKREEGGGTRWAVRGATHS